MWGVDYHNLLRELPYSYFISTVKVANSLWIDLDNILSSQPALFSIMRDAYSDRQKKKKLEYSPGGIYVLQVCSWQLPQPE
jgi:hypothetical protein